jgi:hypothetical protein
MIGQFKLGRTCHVKDRRAVPGSPPSSRCRWGRIGVSNTWTPDFLVTVADRAGSMLILCEPVAVR